MATRHNLCVNPSLTVDATGWGGASTPARTDVSSLSPTFPDRTWAARYDSSGSYARTPSGFEVEYGWGGCLVDDASWEPCELSAVSSWGHTPA